MNAKQCRMFVRTKRVKKIDPSFHVSELSKSLVSWLSQTSFKFSIITRKKRNEKAFWKYWSLLMIQTGRAAHLGSKEKMTPLHFPNFVMSLPTFGFLCQFSWPTQLQTFLSSL